MSQNMGENKRLGRDPGALRMVDSLYSHVPSFTDVFDEETFYIFAMCFVAATVLIAFLASRFVTLKEVV